MDNIPSLGQDESRLFKQVIGQYDAPAFARRARQVEEALTALLEFCRARRSELLEMVGVRLATLRCRLAGDWDTLRPLLAEGDVEILRALDAELNVALRVQPPASSSPRVWRGAFQDLRDSIVRFNRRWLDELHRLDLSPLNELRDKYNRYYVLEKEFALRSARVARQGFVPLAPLTHAELRAKLPSLPVPRLA